MTPYASDLCLVIIGAELGVAGVSKLVWIGGFRHNLSLLMRGPDMMISTLAIALPIVEIVLGVALITLSPPRLMVGSAALLYGTFCAHHARLAWRRPAASCGCQIMAGQSRRVSTAVTAVKAIVLFLAFRYTSYGAPAIATFVLTACAAGAVVLLWVRGRTVGRLLNRQAPHAVRPTS